MEDSQVTETTPTENVPTQPEVEAAPDLRSLIKDLPDAPDQVQLDKWKAQFGNIYVSGFSETELFIWRPLNRVEYKQLQIAQQIEAAINQLGDKATPDEVKSKVTTAIDAEFKREEKLVSQCLLWPKLTPEELAQKAGTVPSLLEQITANSNFLSPQQASLLVMRL